MRPLNPALACCGLLGLAACALEPPEVDVERQWGDAMRRLNMYGFYPASEDVQPGDVFLHVPPENATRGNLARFSLIRLASLPLGDEPARRGANRYEGMGVYQHLSDQQTRDRLAIAAYPSSGGNAPAPAPSASPGTSTTTTTANAQGVTTQTSFTAARAAQATPQTPSTPMPRPATPEIRQPPFEIAPMTGTDASRPRLRLAAIPSLAVGRITQAQLGAAGVLGNIGANLGLARASQTAITIALSQVQELQLDGWRLNALLNYRSDDLFNRMRAEDMLLFLEQMRPALLHDACNGNEAKLIDEQVRIEVINRVMYAGGIDYSFANNAETALRLAIDLQSTLRGQPQAPVIPALGAAPAALGAGAAALPATENAAAAAARLAGLLSSVTGEAGGNARAGVTASFGIGSFGALTLKTTFSRPVAVAAGSRLSLNFFEALRGDRVANAPAPGDPRLTYRAFRHERASEFCRENSPGHDAAALRRAFGLTEGMMPAMQPMRRTAPRPAR